MNKNYLGKDGTEYVKPKSRHESGVERLTEAHFKSLNSVFLESQPTQKLETEMREMKLERLNRQDCFCFVFNVMPD